VFCGITSKTAQYHFKTVLRKCGAYMNMNEKFDWLLTCKRAYDDSKRKYKQLLNDIPFTFTINDRDDFEYTVSYNVQNDNVNVKLHYVSACTITNIIITVMHDVVVNICVDGNDIEHNLKLICILLDNITY
jgi:hypothetical protein